MNPRVRLAARLGRLFIAVLILLSAFPQPEPGVFIAQAAPRVDTPTQPEPLPETRIVPPAPPVTTPSLRLEIGALPQVVLVGESVPVELTITNIGRLRATDLTLTLPTPTGTVAAPGAAQQWDYAALLPGQTITATTRLLVTSLPPGDALILIPTVQATELDQPLAARDGTLVRDPQTQQPATQSFAPGKTTTLRSRDQRVRVTLPPTAAKQRLTVSVGPQSTTATRLTPTSTTTATLTPPETAGFYRGFETFHLNATAENGQPVHTFGAPLTITVQYTPEELDALQITEDNLTLFWFDEELGEWVPQLTTVDRTTRTASIVVTHFSAYQLSDGASPSEGFLPSLQGWQVGLYTGNAAYSYPLDVPAGPAGVKPDLALSYSSSATDGSTRALDQADWVGKGWSLDMPAIALNKIADSTTKYYSLVLNGLSVDLVRGEALVTNPVDGTPSHWAWRAVDENFIKARVIEIPALTGRGGTKGSTAYTRYKWQVWSKDGTLYEFSEDLWWGFEFCSPYLSEYAYLETYKWQLSTVTDVHSNTITYNYGRDSLARTSQCLNVSGTVDREIWPTSIAWGGNTATGVGDRYQVVFDTSTRTNDLLFEGPSNQLGGENGKLRQTKQLDAIRVLSMQSSTWELVRKYALTYDYSLYSDNSLNSNGVYSANPTYPKLTLKDIQRFGNDGTTALPETSFTYGTTRGTTLYPNGNWNRLVTADNGQGGTITFSYATIGDVLSPQDGKYVNYRRVTQKTQTDGRGNSASWQYTYGLPQLNSVGTNYGNSQSTQAEPNSAALYYNKYRYPNTDHSVRLARKAFKEFRGHAWVTETDPAGNQTDHYFYQGDIANCSLINTIPNPDAPFEGSAIETNACFQALRTREFLKGKEYRTVRRAGVGSAALMETEHTFRSVHPTTQTENSADMGNEPFSGLWRAFNYERETLEKIYEENTTAKTKKTVYSYDPAYQVGTTQYGNLTQVEEYDETLALYRKTITQYDTLNTSTRYIVDRVRATTTTDGQSRLLAHTINMYDGNTTSLGLVDRGRLTLARAYANVPLQTSTTNVTLYSQDISLGYDEYGNVTTTTNYTGAGTKLFNGTTSTFSSPGNGSTARTTTTTYDATFHAFSIQTTPPTVNNVTLTEYASYDYRMGTMTRTTDPNGVYTDAVYDVFGRMTKLIQDGDTETIPTLQMTYADWDFTTSGTPYRFIVFMRETSGVSTAYRAVRHFYDGLGREIQTKHETQNDAQNSVVDMRYNGLGQAIWQSQARHVNETPTTGFYYYTAVPTTGIISTTTTYDPLGRPLNMTGPDGTVTSTRYWSSAVGTAATTTDALGHKTRRESDVLGRLRTIIEYSGTGTTGDPHVSYGTTTYSYDPLDRQVSSVDAASNTTTMTYDSLGRKTALSDPDMGAWSYTYDVNGNRLTQTDAKNQTLTWTYDALSREVTKVYPNSGGTVTNYYDQTGENPRYGYGRRTAMTDLTGSKGWNYTPRGEVAQEYQYVTYNGVSTLYTTAHTYNANSSPNTMTYPTGETLTYSYNNAGEQTSIATSLGGSYLSAATYDALGQTLTQTAGNGVVTTNSYDAVTKRLSSLQVQSGGTTGYQRTYTYDTVGNVKTIASASETLRYSYDHRDRLTNACTWTGSACSTAGGVFNETYAYDAIGNLTSKAGTSYTYQSTRPHAVASVGGASYAYDNNGNITSGGGRTYTWNAENLPTQIVNGTTTETYTYDGEGTRVTKTTAVSGGSTTRTVYVGAGLVEYTGTTVVSNYGLATRSSMGNPTTSNLGTLTYIHSDHLGSVSATSTSGGTIGAAQEFTPWGAVRSGSIATTELNYTGQRKDSGTGLLYYNARYYDPVLGRFLSADTIIPDPTNPQARNRYSYVLNNPLKYTDPSGHECADAPSGGSNENSAKNDCKTQIAQYGITFEDYTSWSLHQLVLFLTALHDFQRAAGWSIGEMRNALTNGGRVPILMRMAEPFTGSGLALTELKNGNRGSQQTLITIYDGDDDFKFSDMQFKENIVHELAHAWDYSHGRGYSNGLAGITKDDPTGAASLYVKREYRKDRKRGRGEDFAESVTAYVYGDNPKYIDPKTGEGRMNNQRHDYVAAAFWVSGGRPPTSR